MVPRLFNIKVRVCDQTQDMFCAHPSSARLCSSLQASPEPGRHSLTSPLKTLSLCSVLPPPLLSSHFCLFLVLSNSSKTFLLSEIMSCGTLIPTLSETSPRTGLHSGGVTALEFKVNNAHLNSIQCTQLEVPIDDQTIAIACVHSSLLAL